jgi:hypothetical protein
MAIAKFTKTYNAFSGVDMIVTFGGRWIGELQGISYSVTREKVPMYTMGDPNPRAFSRGKRGIAGALVFALFDRSALIEELNNITHQITTTDVRGLTATGTTTAATFTNGLKHFSKDFASVSDGIDVSEISLKQENNIYLDQILPFNVVIAGANEYGATTQMELVGLELLNAGSGISIDDIQINETSSFLARDIRQWTPGPNGGSTRTNIDKWTASGRRE